MQPLKFAIFGNEYQVKKSASIEKILSCLRAKGAEVYMEETFYKFLVRQEQLPLSVAGVFEEYNFDVDYVISMGVTVPSSRLQAEWGQRERPSLV